VREMELVMNRQWKRQNSKGFRNDNQWAGSKHKSSSRSEVKNFLFLEGNRQQCNGSKTFYLLHSNPFTVRFSFQLCVKLSAFVARHPAGGFSSSFRGGRLATAILISYCMRRRLRYGAMPTTIYTLSSTQTSQFAS
jgi:hypothetical protein